MPGSRLAALLFVLGLLATARPASATASGDELVRQAQAHEAAHEDDVAVRRYMDALTIDGTNNADIVNLRTNGRGTVRGHDICATY